MGGTRCRSSSGGGAGGAGGTGGAGGSGARVALEWSGAVARGRSASGDGAGCAWVGDGGVQASAGVVAAA